MNVAERLEILKREITVIRNIPDAYVSVTTVNLQNEDYTRSVPRDEAIQIYSGLILYYESYLKKEERINAMLQINEVSEMPVNV